MLFFNKIKRSRSFRLISRRKAFRSASCKGSLTVECALVLPLFFLALVTLITFMDAVGLQVRSDLELSNRARKLSMTAALSESLLSDEEEGLWIDLNEVRESPFAVSVVPLPSVKVAARARVYPWIGEAGGGETTTSSDDIMVYVTDNMSVYHTRADCTHLDLAVRAVTLSQIDSLRNIYGKRYKACPDFPSGYTGLVYVTDKGDYYYPSTAYNSLTRHVRMVRLSEVSSLPACSRCGGAA